MDWKFLLTNTSELDKLKVTIKEIPNKGVGLVATKCIDKGEIIAYYKIRAFKKSTYKSPSEDVYSFAIYKKNGMNIKP